MGVATIQAGIAANGDAEESRTGCMSSLSDVLSIGREPVRDEELISAQ